MNGAKPAEVGGVLIDRLNDLRIMHSSKWGNSLDQIEWKARGIERLNHSGYLAVVSMIAALRGDHELVLQSAMEIEAQYSHSMGDRLNALRSLTTSRLAEATGYASRIAADHLDGSRVSPRVLSTVGACLSMLGESREAANISRRFFEVVPDPDLTADVAWLSSRIRVAEAFDQAGVEDGEFSSLIKSSFEVLGDAGWPYAGVNVSPISASFEDGPLAVLEFFIDVDSDWDLVMEVEDRVMQEISANRLFAEIKVVVAVSAAEPSEKVGPEMVEG